MRHQSQHADVWLAMCWAILTDAPFCRINPAVKVAYAESVRLEFRPRRRPVASYKSQAGEPNHSYRNKRKRTAAHPDKRPSSGKSAPDTGLLQLAKPGVRSKPIPNSPQLTLI